MTDSSDSNANPNPLHNPNDPRVRKTRKGLREAFIHLILKKGYDAISIQDIADEAQTARITFYRHYRDKEALLTDCLNTLYEELIEKTERLNPQRVLDGYSPALALYEHMREQEQLYRILFSSRGTYTVIERMRYHLAQVATETLERAMQIRGIATPLPIPPQIVAHHAASAQIGLAIWWLDHNKPYSSEYMAQVSLWLSLMGAVKLFGVDDFAPPLPVQ
jgi:AcrR family transcriptional regulator